MKRVWIFLLAAMLVFGVVTPGFASETTTGNDQNVDIGVYAKYSDEVIRVTSPVESGSSQIETASGLSITLSGAASTAVTATAATIPSSEEAAWAWLESCLGEDVEPVEAFELYLQDADGNAVSTAGAQVSVPVPSAEEAYLVYGVNKDGTVTLLPATVENGQVTFTADGSDYYVLAKKVETPEPSVPDESQTPSAPDETEEPEDPDTTETPSESETTEAPTEVAPTGATESTEENATPGAGNAPPTGDGIGLWIMMFVLSGVVLIVLLTRRKEIEW